MKAIISGFITHQKYPWAEAVQIDFTTLDPRKYSQDSEWPTSVIREHSFEVDVPDDFDPRPQQVASIEASIQQVRAEFSARITELQERKSKLLALTMEAQPS